MARDNEDILRWLDAAISALKSEFKVAQDGLAQQISAANNTLGHLMGILAGKTSGGAGDHEEKLEPALRELAGRERAEGAATQHVAEIEKNVRELKSEVALLRSQEAWLVAANQDLSERLVMIRTEGKVAARNLDAAETENQRLRKTFAEKEAQIQALQRQVEHLQDNAPEVAKRLSKDVTSLRYDNTRLRAAVEDAEAKIEGRDKQQRILLESLFTNGRTCRIGELLVSAGVIRREQLDEALKDQDAGRKKLLGAILTEKGFAREEEVSQAVACQCRVPFVFLASDAVSNEAARLVDVHTCQEHQCIPVRCDSERVFLAMANPRDNAAFTTVEQKSGRRVIPFAATPTDVSSAIRSVYGPH